MNVEPEPHAGTARGVGTDWHPFVTARAWPNDRISEAFEQ
jgi:hypothetical protein